MAEPYRGILGPVLGQVEAIKSARSNRAMDELQSKYLQQGFEARQQEQTQQTAAKQARAELEYATNIWGAVAQSDDVVAASQRLIVGNPKFLDINKRHGLGDFSDPSGMPPEQMKSTALDNWRALGGVLQQGQRPAGLVEFDELTKIAQEQSPRGEAARVRLGTQSRATPGRIVMVGNVPTLVDDQGSVIQQMPLSTLQQEATGAATVAGAERAATEAATTAEVPSRVTAETRNKRLATHIDEGFAASDAMPIIRRSLELLGTVKTGGIHAAQLAASNLLGVTGADEAELSQNLGKAVLAQLRTTFGAAFTEREGARLERIEAEFGKSTEANVRLLEQLQKMVEREALRGINAAIQMGDQQTADQIREGLNFSLGPQGAAPQSAAPKEPTATNPQTGEKLVLRNGQWVPMNATTQ